MLTSPYRDTILALTPAITILEMQTGDGTVTTDGETLKGMLSVLTDRLTNPELSKVLGYDDELWRSLMIARGCKSLTRFVPEVQPIVVPAIDTLEDTILRHRGTMIYEI
jgi:hypothetical protein